MTVTEGFSSTCWQVAAASVTGFSHEADGIPCQDSYAIATIRNTVIAAISDGAGSATHADKGAQTLAKTVMLSLREFLRLRDGPLDIGITRSILIEAVELARDTLSKSGVLSDYAATLVGFIAHPYGGIIFHIGDGTALAVRSQDWLSAAVSPPENGEYVNETFFFTAEKWVDHLRLIAVDGPYDTWIAMSDGCMPFAMARGNTGLFRPFIEPLAAHLSITTELEASAALSGTLSRPEIRPITGDDKTFIWAYCRESTAA